MKTVCMYHLILNYYIIKKEYIWQLKNSVSNKRRLLWKTYDGKNRNFYLEYRYEIKISKTLTIGEPKGTNPETTVDIKLKSNKLVLYFAI